jgi:hypothetical protein
VQRETVPIALPLTGSTGAGCWPIRIAASTTPLMKRPGRTSAKLSYARWRRSTRQLATTSWLKPTSTGWPRARAKGRVVCLLPAVLSSRPPSVGAVPGAEDVGSQLGHQIGGLGVSGVQFKVVVCVLVDHRA